MTRLNLKEKNKLKRYTDREGEREMKKTISSYPVVAFHIARFGSDVFQTHSTYICIHQKLTGNLKICFGSEQCRHGSIVKARNQQNKHTGGQGKKN